MSAIAGHLGGFRGPEPARMLESLAHRGAEAGSWSDGFAFLGARGGASLVADEEAIAVADARLDDPLPGAPSPSDAGRVLAAYRRFGDACADRLSGDFAFAVYDRRQRRLLCARDAFGVKPLFFRALANGGFAFASEIKALLALPGGRPPIDEARIADYLLELDDDPERTFFRDVRRLPAGHLVVAGSAPRRYWDPGAATPPPCRTAEEWASEFRARLRDAVGARLRGPARVGSMLSGGLDTSSIVGLAREARPGLTTFSVRFADHPEADESPWFGAVIRQGGVDARIIPGERVRPERYLPRFLEREDEPLWAPYVFLHAAIYEEARESGVAAVMDGLEGDATVSFGWGRLPRLLATGRWWTLGREIAALARRTGRRSSRIVRAHCVQPFVPGFARGAWRRLRGKEPWWIEGSVIRPEFARRTGVGKRIAAARLPVRSARAEHRRDLLSPALPHCCEMFDAAGAHFGVEPRHPFLDRRLAELCLAVPPELKLRDGYTRWLQRAALRGVLPEEVRWRPAKNLSSPAYARGLLRHGDGDLLDEIERHAGLVSEFVDMDLVREARARFAALGALADAKRVWYAGHLALWLAREERMKGVES